MIPPTIPPTIRRLLIIRPGALGDTLLAFPALALLRRAYPQAHLTLVARADVLPLARAWGLADAVSPYDASQWSALFAETLPPDTLLRTHIAGSAVLAWLTDTHGLVAANLRALGAETVTIGPGRPREDQPDPTHAALQLTAALAALGIPVPSDTTALYDALPALPLALLSNTTGASAERPPGTTVETSAQHPSSVGTLPAAPTGPPRYVALHPGSGGAAKRWPLERFATLAGELSRLDARPLLIAGPQDAAISETVLADSARLGIALPVARDLTVVALARLLSTCAAYVGNDSGVSHLAGLLGLPTLALFGPTDPAIWSPIGPNVHALRASSGATAALSVAHVATALRPLLRAP